MASFTHWHCVTLMVVAGLVACGTAEPEQPLPTAGTGGAGSGSSVAGSSGAAAVGGGSGAGASGGYAGASGWSGGGAGGSSSAGQSGSAAGRSGSGGAAGASGSAAGGGGSSGSSGSGAAANKFCSDYQTHCGFGAAMRYTNLSDCTTKYAAWTSVRQMCITMHLGFVIEKMGTADYEPYKTMHCPHANGLGPCAATTP